MTELEIKLLKRKIDLLEKEVNYYFSLEIKDPLKRLRNDGKILNKLKSLMYQRKRYAKHTGNNEEFEKWMKEKGEHYIMKIEKSIIR